MPKRKKERKKLVIEVRSGEIYEFFCCRVLLVPIPGVKPLSPVDISSF